jgi:uncharacterized membrane protein YGL010W
MAVKTIHEWLSEYAESHQNPLNKLIHWICVPLIALSLIGMLWDLPVPAAFRDISPAMNWGMLFMMASIVYYFILSPALAIGMVAIMALFAIVLWQLDSFDTPLWLICVAVFVLAWIGQFVGHVAEGKRPSFFKDVQFLMIGPLWIMSFVYRRLGIRF